MRTYTNVKNLMILVIFSLIANSFAYGDNSYSCKRRFTYSDCNFFCGTQAENFAKECALILCESRTGKRCEILRSTNKEIEAGQTYFVGFAIAVPTE